MMTKLKSIFVMLGLLIALSACDLHDVGMSADIEPPRADAKTVVEKKPSDLDSGATQHKVTAQGKTLKLEYSTKQAPLKWHKDKRANVWLYASMPKANKNLTTKITYIRAEYADGTVVLEDTGEFVITPPYTFGTVLAAYPATIHLTIDVLVETEEDSGEFYKQRFIDTLQLTPAQ